MVTYNILLGVVIVLGLIQHFYFSKNKPAKFVYILICGVLCFLISGFRYGIGFDYYAYLDIFEDIGNLPFSYSAFSEYRYEFGFTLFIRLLTMITPNGQTIYVIIAALAVSCAMIMIYKYSKIPMLSLVVYITLNHFFVSMNLLRYALSGLIVFASYGILKNSKFDFSKESFKPKAFLDNLLKNFLPYLLLIIVAGTFHKTAYLMIPVYFVAKLDLNKITGIIYGAGTLLIILLAKPFAYTVSEIFFGGAYNPYDMGTPLADTFYTAAGLTYIYVPGLILIAVLVLKKKILKNDPSNIVLINMNVYSFIIYLMSATSLYIFNRVAYFPYIFMILLVPEIVNSLKPDEQQVIRLDEIKQKMKGANKNEQNRLIKETKELKTKVTDSRIFYSFAIGITVVVGLLHYALHGKWGSNNVYPYRSLSTTYNMYNFFNFTNDRQERSYDLQVANSIDNLLNELKDPDYVFIFTTQIASGEFEEIPTDWQQSTLNKFGLETQLKNEVGNNYIAVVDGMNPVYETTGQGELSESINIDSINIDVMVNNETSSIKINGIEYSTEKIKGNIVVYDKKLKKVVTSANMNPTFKATVTKMNSMFYTTKKLEDIENE